MPRPDNHYLPSRMTGVTDDEIQVTFSFGKQTFYEDMRTARDALDAALSTEEEGERSDETDQSEQ